MKYFYALSVVLIMSVALSAQSHQCTLMSSTCCSEDDDYFEMIPVVSEKPLKSNGTKIYANQVPIVHYDGKVDRYPLEIRIETIQDVVSATMDYYDFETFSYLVSDLVDDGIGLDKEGGDATYTSLTPIVQSRNIRNDDILYHYSLISGTVTLTYADGITEEFRTKLDGYTIVGDSIKLDTTNLEINRIGSISYTENAVNYVLPQEYSYNLVNFPLKDVLKDFKNIWTDFDDSFFVFTILSETNAGNASFQTSANPLSKFITNVSSTGMSTVYPLNHEINHFWVYSSEFNFVQSHLRYIERPQSGFGYGCYSGVMTNIYEENGSVKYEVNEADNPNEYFFNDLELNLMGVLPVDSVDFPIKYFKRNSFSSSDCNKTFKTLSDGSIEYLSKNEYIDFVSGIDLEDISDGFDLKFIFLTEEPISKLDHAFLEYLVLNYEDIFEESTSGLVDLDTEIYKLLPSSNNTLQDQNSVLIYPNPTDKLITLELETKSDAELLIFDMAGKVLKTDIAQNGSNLYDVSDLPSGLYMMKIINSEGLYWTARMVKN